MARALAGDASARRGEKESEWETDAGTKRLPLRTLLGALAESLARSDSLMRRLIPGLAIIFIVILALFRTGDLVSDYTRTQENAQVTLSLMATVVASGLMSSENDLPETGYRTTLKRILADSLPTGATSKGRIYLVADQSGTIVASAPLQPSLESRPISDLLGPSQPLMVFGARAGVMPVATNLGTGRGQEQVLATVHHLDGRLGMVAVLQPENEIFSQWRDDLSANVTLFVGTSLVLLAVIYGFFSQATRAEAADDMYAATRARIDTALTHGRCGLFDWDLSRGRMFWSSSLYELLGREPKDDILSFADVADITHPDDIDLLGLAEHLLESGETLVDETFRMRHADGSWIWLRARGEIQSEPGRAEPHLIGICIDITEQHELAEQSRMADLRLRDAIETISEAFVLWNARNELVICNSNYQSLHSLPNAVIKPGTPYKDVMAAASNAEVAPQPVTLRQRGGAPDGSYEAQLEDGRWLQISERRTKDGGFVSVGTDITPLKKHEEKLIDSEKRLRATVSDLQKSRQTLEVQARQLVEMAEKYQEEKTRAEAANKAKSEFLANISHELRTPLNAIIGFSDIMTQEMFGPVGTDRYSDYCKDIYSSGTYLLNVINDILDMSKIEAGRMSIETETVNASESAEDASRIVTGAATEKNITVTTDVVENVSVHADKRALKQILLNLLANAVKFTPDNGTVTLRARPRGDKLHFEVIDTGIGISERDIERLAQPFVQVENQFTKTHQGSGLGLAIARSLVELHGGALVIKSEVKKGTTVSFTLPLADKEAA
ncbi:MULTISPECIES: PAS domain-containing sensor histidine kinase [Stappiaceae]|jgi:two-component system cell cycle sensor histidine kinase PleC|uniref:PAS domain-containing sensor histidine kinase n=1 Tax=Stappiaceae TaxID=2821832 RepID=UPI00094B1BF9|nr:MULTISPECIES: PAS domain-containing sensor histidine kinase [Stappiaceae]MCR9280241.1 ATP-binding protein [Paracoccaceae bacterium]MEC9417497.1 ATP-binding protein [Pseudomonadota bacterium]MBN8180278.1 PAS-domain containing protein [Roseibium aggregatum]MBO9458186.1 PAS-domain containing protein [Labrenzia sp. R5_0]MEE2864198.1 ATP-binding protein [Pseudomonadota bacterium]